MGYDRPSELSKALELLASGDRKVLAGGTDLYPATDRQTLEGPVLDITSIAELKGIRHDADSIRIGAATTWRDIFHAELPEACNALKLAAREVGSVQIQNSGTIGGNLCNASPAADGVPPLLILDAELDLISASNRRRIPLGEFITGNRETTLKQGEILEAVHIPKSSLEGRSHFLKLGARKHLIISIVMVAARLECDAGRIVNASVSVGACSAVAQRMNALETQLKGQKVDGISVGPELLSGLSPIDDIRADAHYRRGAAGEMILRTLQACT